MSFILQGEVNIDGRQGTVALKSIQREATRTSQAFERTGGSASKLVASFLKADSAASVFGTSLRALGKFGAAGILGSAGAAAINKFGEAVKKNASDYYQTQKSLADAFEKSFRSQNVDEARAGLERTRDIAEELRGKLTQLGALGNLLGGFERLTGLKIFGVEDNKKALEQAEEQLIAQEKIVQARQKEKQQIDAIAETTRSQSNQRKITIETLKLIDGIRKTKKATIPILQAEIDDALALRDENQRILEILEKTNQAERNNEEIQKRKIASKQLELNITKAQNALTIQRFKETGETLGGSRAGQQALSAAQRQRERADKNRAFREEEASVRERQAQENKKRAQEGLPPLNVADVRNRMATEAVGGDIVEGAVGAGMGLMGFSTGNLLDMQKADLAASIARQQAAPSDFKQRVDDYKAREAQKVMQQGISQKKQKDQIIDFGARGSSGYSGENLASAINSLAKKIPSAVPV